MQHSFPLVRQERNKRFLRRPFAGLDASLVLASGRGALLSAPIQFKPRSHFHGDSEGWPIGRHFLTGLDGGVAIVPSEGAVGIEPSREARGYSESARCPQAKLTAFAIHEDFQPVGSGEDALAEGWAMPTLEPE